MRACTGSRGTWRTCGVVAFGGHPGDLPPVQAPLEQVSHAHGQRQPQPLFQAPAAPPAAAATASAAHAEPAAAHHAAHLWADGGRSLSPESVTAAAMAVPGPLIPSHLVSSRYCLSAVPPVICPIWRELHLRA